MKTAQSAKTASADHQDADVRDRELQIAFFEETVDDLHRRLDGVRWPESGFDAGWGRGADDGTVRELVRYWRHDYDWSAVETELNRLEHRVVSPSDALTRRLPARPPGR